MKFDKMNCTYLNYKIFILTVCKFGCQDNHTESAHWEGPDTGLTVCRLPVPRESFKRDTAYLAAAATEGTGGVFSQ